MPDSDLPVPSHSASSRQCRLSIPPAGRGLKHIHRKALAFRRGIEAALLAQHNELNEAMAKRIRTAAKALLRAMEVDRWLAVRGHEMDAAEWQSWADRSLKYEEVCDRALDKLGLDARPSVMDDWKAAYAAMLAAPLPAPDAPAAADDNQAGQSNTPRPDASQAT